MSHKQYIVSLYHFVVFVLVNSFCQSLPFTGEFNHFAFSVINIKLIFICHVAIGIIYVMPLFLTSFITDFFCVCKIQKF